MENSRNTSTLEPERFPISPPKLKRLASQEMSLILYRHLAENCRGDDILNEDWFSANTYDPKSIIDVTPVISGMIEECVWYPTAVSIEFWCMYHESYIFYDSNLHQGVLNCIHDFVLKPNGIINYRNTAKNILTGDRMNLVEKFRFACLYSLVDDVRSIWPKIQDDPRVTDSKLEDNPMVHYWICIMKGESPRFPGIDPDSFDSYLTVLETMDWMSIEYFWNVLSADEQVTAAKKLLGRVNGVDTNFIEPLFLRLNKTQLRRVMEEIDVADTIFRPFFEIIWPCSKILEIWSYVKYFISAIKFQEIIHLFIRTIFIDNIEDHEFSTLLFKIWSSAPDELKRSFLNDFEAVENIFRELNTKRTRMVDHHHDMRFFIALLTELSFQSRSALWREFWPGLIFNVYPKCLDQMLKLCLNNDDEIVQFKERVMLDFDKLELFCFLSFLSGCISQLNDYLNFCSSNAHYVADVKRQIIRWEPLIKLVFAKEGNLSCKSFIDLDKFIDSAFFDEDDARGFKKEMLASHESLRKLWSEVDKTELGLSWI